MSLTANVASRSFDSAQCGNAVIAVPPDRTPVDFRIELSHCTGTCCSQTMTWRPGRIRA